MITGAAQMDGANPGCSCYRRCYGADQGAHPSVPSGRRTLHRCFMNKCDMVDDPQELLELVEMEITEQLEEYQGFRSESSGRSQQRVGRQDHGA